MSQDNNALNDFYRRVYIDKTQNPGTYQYPDYSVTGIYPTCHILQSPTPSPGVRSKVYISQQEHMTPTQSQPGLTGPNILKKPARVGGKAHDTLKSALQFRSQRLPFDELETFVNGAEKPSTRKRRKPLHPH